MIRAARPWVMAVGLATFGGCLPRQATRPVSTVPTASSEWPAAYAQATSEARESRYDVADRVLTGFAQRFPGSPEALEVTYWRAVYKLDPGNGAASREAVALLDSYLATAPGGQHRVEASAMRRLATTIESRTAALAAQAAMPVPKAEDKSREEEILRLRDELSKANAELERIKLRLSRPRH